MIALSFSLALSSLLAAQSASGPALDVTPIDPATVEARALFEEGRIAFDEQRYEVARAWFRLAWDKKKLPELVFNIAQCDFELGEHADAIRHYEQYLLLVPTTPNRAVVEELIDESKAALKRKPQPGPMDAVHAAVRAVIPSSLRGDGSSRAPSPNIKVDGDEPIVWAGAIAGTVTLVAVGALAWTMAQPPHRN